LWVGREIQPALRSWLLEDGAGALMWSPNTAPGVGFPHKARVVGREQSEGEAGSDAGGRTRVRTRSLERGKRARNPAQGEQADDAAVEKGRQGGSPQ
jgi:hypothetical protein